MKRVNLIPVARPERKVYLSSDLAKSSKQAIQKLPMGSNGVVVGEVRSTPTHPPHLPILGGNEKKEQISLATLLDQAEQLSQADRKTLLARLSLASQNRETESCRDKDMWSQAVYEELLKAYGRGLGAAQGPANVKRSLSLPTAWAPLADFMASSNLADLKVVERFAVYSMLAKLVVKQALYVARKVDAPLSAKLVGTCAANVASLFDNAFPGYLQSGLAPVVARQLVAGGQNLPD